MRMPLHCSSKPSSRFVTSTFSVAFSFSTRYSQVSVNALNATRPASSSHFPPSLIGLIDSVCSSAPPSQASAIVGAKVPPIMQTTAHTVTVRFSRNRIHVMIIPRSFRVLPSAQVQSAAGYLSDRCYSRPLPSETGATSALPRARNLSTERAGPSSRTLAAYYFVSNSPPRFAGCQSSYANAPGHLRRPVEPNLSSYPCTSTTRTSSTPASPSHSPPSPRPTPQARRKHAAPLTPMEHASHARHSNGHGSNKTQTIGANG